VYGSVVLLLFVAEIYKQLGRLQVLLPEGVAQDVDFEFWLIGFSERWRHWVRLTVNGHLGIFFWVIGTTNLVPRFMTDGSGHSLVDEVGSDDSGCAVAVEDVGL